MAADECDEPATLTFAEEIAEKLGRLLSAPVFDTAELRHVDTVEVYGLTEVERRESLVRDLPSARFVHDAESGVVEIPSEILRFVDVETQHVVLGKLPHNNVGCLALATGENENHDW